MNRRKVGLAAKQPKTLETILIQEKDRKEQEQKKELTQERWKARRKHL